MPCIVLMRGVVMKYPLFVPLVASLFVASSFSQEPIYRCGNEYTNTKPTSEKSGCKLLEGSNVTVIQGTKPNANAPVRVAAATQSSTLRIDSGDQKSRDSDARQILESELKKAEARQAELVREYNNGEPEKQGGEARNNQKYLDRIAELKASLSRNESDIAGIRRELGRLPASK
jgi:hypothetical protein